MNQAKLDDPYLPAEVPYFGKEVVNRVSFLREDAEFISSAVLHTSTRFIFYENGNPLVNKARSEGRLVILTNGTDQLATVPDTSEAGTTHGLLDNSAQWKTVLETWAAENKDHAPALRDSGKPSLLFLGLKDESVGLDFHQLKLYEKETYLDHQGRYFGIPYFGVDVSNASGISELVKQHIVLSTPAVNKDDLVYTDSRKHTMAFTMEESALFSHGKMYFDWLGRNRFCPGCGSKVIGIHAGGKLRCTNDNKIALGDEEKYECPVKNTRVSNVSFPRTDAVVITAIVNREKTKMLLSLSKRYAHTKMYSCTAGFMEPSETVEVATRREIWEETGVACSDIQILMTQPWPFPGNLMIGCVATVDFNGLNEVIHLGHDRELADARWFDVSFVRKLIHNTAGDENPDGIVLPTDVSIAYTLIKHAIEKTELKL
ncbi:hypothetical protein METBIDRAFT_77048 [Metschnikowia bicuspidata var. bicuspidata NRRL YB-4993]|uniref:NAD(+) diphosphatase n=1 Tax=Metschnikowia bicuspidata var. bicuspidata NRRL YB-4993 TaxID=869754 RepID=A0A1A0HK79_9ASCO|nr:hypothetical protein METBIDRAFT_77048 [Metschnikowia bicuspidata var. bicuspidata NRRL YB-4993]OBA24208.1 hypothetical protein METBIDRAFT_77048 [Metschnikowia bicuspidata var. bicuspidata NRRL YB-4993]